MPRATVAVTGATGFIGGKLSDELERSGRIVRRLSRQKASDPGAVRIENIGSDTDWSAALEGIDCVIHTAAKAHATASSGNPSLAEFREVNCAGTRRLAEHAAQMGVRRLVFLSSAGVLGNSTKPTEVFGTNTNAAPVENYAISKWEAEKALHEVGHVTDLEIVVIRPPLVYGERAPGNIGRLVRLLELGVPLPFGAIRNERSLVSLNNLISLLSVCIDHTGAAGKTFLVSDGPYRSTPELCVILGDMIGKKARLVPVPVPFLQLIARIAGRSQEVERLVGSLRIDDSYTRETLGWKSSV